MCKVTHVTIAIWCLSTLYISNLVRVIFVSLLANALAYILRSESSKDMGRKFCGQSGVFPGLGRVTIVACNISEGKEAVEAASS